MRHITDLTYLYIIGYEPFDALGAAQISIKFVTNSK